MQNNPIVYEVNLTIARHRAAEFDAWLSDHVNAMLDLPGFVDATLFDEHTDQEGDVVQRSVHYRLRDRTALERYFSEHAPRMRAEGVNRFGSDMAATRRILARHNDGELCANCKTPLAGQYCVECGQRHRTRMISLWELLRDVFEDAFSWDSRVWRSLRPLLLQPGKLTSEYLDGRRMYYTPPLRMYLVLSISFFLLSSLPALEDFNAASMLQVNPNPAEFELRFGPDSPQATPPDNASGDPPTVATTADRPVDQGDNEVDDDEDDFDCNFVFEDATISVPGVSDVVVRERLRQVCLSIKTTEGRARFIDKFADLLPQLLIVMLPFTALAGKFIYPLSRRYYVEHLLFYTHFHSFLFLLLIVTMCITAVTDRIASLSWLSRVFDFAVGVYAVYYLYRALRHVFGQGRVMTLFKMFLIGFSYSMAATMLALVGVGIAALSL